MRFISNMSYILLLICVLGYREVSSQGEMLKRFVSLFAGVYSMKIAPKKPMDFLLRISDTDTEIHNRRVYVISDLFIKKTELIRSNLFEIRDFRKGILVSRIAPKKRWYEIHGYQFNRRNVAQLAEMDIQSRSHCFLFKYHNSDTEFVSYADSCQSPSKHKLFNITYMELNCHGIAYLQDVASGTIRVDLQRDVSYANTISPRWRPSKSVC